jgi:hypothetical protein
MAMKPIKRLYGSPAYVTVSSGPGEFAGAGELPPRGPGVAAKRKISAVVSAQSVSGASASRAGRGRRGV